MNAIVVVPIGWKRTTVEIGAALDAVSRRTKKIILNKLCAFYSRGGHLPCDLDCLRLPSP